MAQEGTRVAREVTVRGRVQGVFFRQTCVLQARTHGVTGWVRNDPDGTVTAHLEGPPDAVEAMVAWCRTGPRAAQVDGVEVTEVAPQQMEEFGVRRG